MNSKLERQLAELLDADIINPSTAQKITAFYDSKERNKPNRLFTIFGVLGALLSGLGIILIIAHNWDDMPRTVKTAFAFIPLVIGQIACGYSLIKKKNTTWIESSTTFLILAVGATISLVSQIYNIPGNLSSFLLVWISITAPLIYLLRSNLAAIIHLVLTTWYACSFGYFYENEIPWWYLILFIWVLPFYYMRLKKQPKSNITGLLNWLVPLSLVITLGSFFRGPILFVIAYMALFGLFYNIGQLSIYNTHKLRRNGFSIVGSLGTIFVLLLLTFEWFWKDALNYTYYNQDLVITVVIFVAALAVIGYLFFKKLLKKFNLFQYAFLVLGLLFLINNLGSIYSIVITNILVLSLGIFAIRIGLNKSSYGILNYGLLIIAVLIACRFFDTNLDFIVRGILFISVGVGFFMTNYVLLKKQRNAAINSKNASHE